MRVDWPLAACLLILLPGCQTPLGEQAVPEQQIQAPPVQQLPQFLHDPARRLQSNNADDRAKAAFELSKLEAAAAPAVPHLIARLDDTEPAVLSRYLGGGYYSRLVTTPAAEAARALGKMGDAAAKALIPALEHAEPVVRQHAAKALGMMRVMQAIQPLVDALSDPDPQVRAAVVIALSHYRHPRAVQRLVDQLPRLGVRARRDLIYVLAKINDPAVGAALRGYATHPDAELRAAVAYAMGAQADPRLRPVLAQMLGDRDATVRANAAHALGNYGGTELIAPLIAALDDDSETVRQSALHALFQLTGKKLGTDVRRWEQWWREQGLDAQRPVAPLRSPQAQ